MISDLYLESIVSFFCRNRVSGQTPWTIVRRFGQISFHPCNSSLEGAMKLIFASFCSSGHALPLISCFAEFKIFSFWSKTMDYISQGVA